MTTLENRPNTALLVVDVQNGVVEGAYGRDAVVANCDYVGEGYGIPTEAMGKAVRMLAQEEGILLDPVYSGKAMAAETEDIHVDSQRPVEISDIQLWNHRRRDERHRRTQSTPAINRETSAR